MQTLPSPSQENKPHPINFVLCEGLPIEESKVVHGILLESSSPSSTCNTESKPIKVAVYNISMAGDSEELFSDVKLETMAACSATCITDGTLRLMTKVVNRLVDLEVGLVACQKCIHPLMKQNLKEKVR